MTSLLDKARKVPVNGRGKLVVDPQELELAIAYFQGEIALKAAQAVMGGDSPGGATYRLATQLRRAIANGMVTIARRP